MWCLALQCGTQQTRVLQLPQPRACPPLPLSSNGSFTSYRCLVHTMGLESKVALSSASGHKGNRRIGVTEESDAFGGGCRGAVELREPNARCAVFWAFTCSDGTVISTPCAFSQPLTGPVPPPPFCQPVCRGCGIGRHATSRWLTRRWTIATGASTPTQLPSPALNGTVTKAVLVPVLLLRLVQVLDRVSGRVTELRAVNLSAEDCEPLKVNRKVHQLTHRVNILEEVLRQDQKASVVALEAILKDKALMAPSLSASAINTSVHEPLDLDASLATSRRLAPPPQSHSLNISADSPAKVRIELPAPVADCNVTAELSISTPPRPQAPGAGPSHRLSIAHTARLPASGPAAQAPAQSVRGAPAEPGGAALPRAPSPAQTLPRPPSPAASMSALPSTTLGAASVPGPASASTSSYSSSRISTAGGPEFEAMLSAFTPSIGRVPAQGHGGEGAPRLVPQIQRPTRRQLISPSQEPGHSDPSLPSF